MAEMSRPETIEGQSQASVSESREASATRGESYSDEKAVYEVGFHVVSTLSEGEASAIAEKIRTEIKKSPSTTLGTGEAEIISEGALQKMQLAYTIERAVSGSKGEKHTSSYFGWIKFETAPEAIPALQATLRSMHDILRFILIETVREDITTQPRRAVFSSDRLEGKTIEKRTTTPEKKGEVSDEELDKSIEALVS